MSSCEIVLKLYLRPGQLYQYLESQRKHIGSLRTQPSSNMTEVIVTSLPLITLTPTPLLYSPRFYKIVTRESVFYAHDKMITAGFQFGGLNPDSSNRVAVQQSPRNIMLASYHA